METIQKKTIYKSKSNTISKVDAPVVPDVEMKLIPISQVKLSRNNYRKSFDQQALQSFAEEIALHGIVSPLLLRPLKAGYEVVAGERRYRAALLANFKHIPATVRTLSDEEVMEIQLVENLQRENPHPLHEAQAISIMLKQGSSVDDLAKRLGKNKAYIYNRMKLADLIPEIQQMFLADKFSISQAQAIAVLAQESQQEFYKGYCKDWQEKEFKINNLSYILSNFRFDLKNAPFDTRDVSLLPEAGDCQKCPFNSASLKSLFPELAETAICNNNVCFRNKTSLSLEITLKAILADGLPDYIIKSSNLSPVEEEVYKKFPQIHSIKERDIYEVDRKEIPSAPSKVNFQQEDGKGKIVTDEKAFQQALEEYKTDMQEVNTMLANGMLKKGLYFHRSTASLIYISTARRNGNGQMTSAKDVQIAIKNGTVTNEQLQAEIERLKAKEKRSKELDREKVQLEVHSQFQESLKGFDKDGKITPSDETALRLLIFQSLNYTTLKEAYKLLFPKHKNPYSVQSKELFDALSRMDNAVLRQFVRLAITGRSDAKTAGNITSLCLYHVAQDAGLDVLAIEKSQQEIVAIREKRVKERIAQVKKQIKKN